MAARRPRGTRRWFYGASSYANDDSLLILRVQDLEREIRELKSVVMKGQEKDMKDQEKTMASLESMKDGLNDFMNNFMSSITIAETGETPMEVPGGAAETT
jgi:hypothetical protein